MNPRLIEEMGYAMGEVYGAVTDRILINLARHFKYISRGAPITGTWDYQVKRLAEMGQVTRETEQIILDSLGGADEALRGVLEEAIMNSLADVEKPLQNAAKKGLLNGGGFIPPQLSAGQTQAFQAFYQQSADKLNLVNTVMLESTQAAYQSTVSDIVNRINATQGILNAGAGELVTGVSSMNSAIRAGVQKMVENGLTGFIDHGGHHWSPEAYVTMDMRTTLANTGRAATFERMDDYGDDLYMVSWHDGARPLCYPWQGKVISRSNRSGTTEDVDGNSIRVYAQSETSYGEPAGLFGINCGHYPMPWIPGYSVLREPQQSEEENAKDYEESQKQRALERQLRAEKRDLEVLKAQGASEEEIKAQKLRVRQAGQELDDFCDETGRARRRNREYTPINATWPDGYKPPSGGTMIRGSSAGTGSGILSGGASTATQKSTFTPASTRAEAEAYAKRFADVVNYNGNLSLSSMNAVNEALTELTEQYPTDKLMYIKQNARMSALARASGGTLEVNGQIISQSQQGVWARAQQRARDRIAELDKMYPSGVPDWLKKDYKEYQETLKFARWSIDDEMIGAEKVKQTIRHEYGHILADQRCGQTNKSYFCKSYSTPETTAKRTLIETTFKKARANGDIYKLSMYGNTNSHEFFAETFSAMLKGDKLPDYFYDMVRKVIE